MADYIFTIPDDVVREVEDSFAKQNGYREEVPNPAFTPDREGQVPERIPNPQKKSEFMLNKITAFVKESTRSYIVSAALQVEANKVNSEVDARIVITPKLTAVNANEEPLEP